MQTIKYTVKYYPSDKTSVLSGSINYRAAFLIRRNARYKILNKTYVVRDIKLAIANTKTNSETQLTIYINPRF